MSLTGGLSYSACAQSTEVFPKRDQAIVFPLIEDLTNEDYAAAVELVVPSSKIIFQSRMSKSRMCFYFDSVATLNKFMDEHSQIKIKDHTLEARHLVNPLKQLTISNVCPIIPHSVIVKELSDKTGIALHLPMKFINAGHTKPTLKHILSFRRSIQFDPDNTDMSRVPDSITINYDNEEFRVFLSTESNMKCFLCKNTGHPAKKCPNKEEIENQQKEIQEAALQAKNSDSNKNTKRGAPTITSTDESTKPAKRKRSRKSKKLSNSSANDSPKLLSELELEEIGNHLDVHPDLKKDDSFITKDKFIELVENLRVVPDKLAHAKSYTQDLASLSSLLEEIKPMVSASAKRTLTCFQKVIEEETSNDEESISEDVDDDLEEYESSSENHKM